MNGLTPHLYRSVLKACRLCDANTGLRRHVLSRLVRHRVAVGAIDSRAATAAAVLLLVGGVAVAF